VIIRNLILVHRGAAYARDFEEIAQCIHRINPTLRILHLPATLKARLPQSDWMFPTLTVVLQKSIGLPVLRGPVLRNMSIGKFDQQDLFRSNRLATPPAQPFSFGMSLDPIMFGDFVVLKPGDLAKTSKGDRVFLFRRKRLASLREQDLPPDHPLRLDRGSYIVQRFIDTGRLPCHYRVQTMFGRVLYCWRQTLQAERPPLNAADSVIESAVVASQGGERTFELAAEQDVLELACAVHRALPDTPILGVDIVRDAASGKLYVLECNAGGNTWHFSSEMGAKCRASLGGFPGCTPEEADARGRLALINQFGAFERAAEVLVELTLDRAA
jgi:hypothetical protein